VTGQRSNPTELRPQLVCQAFQVGFHGGMSNRQSRIQSRWSLLCCSQVHLSYSTLAPLGDETCFVNRDFVSDDVGEPS
jgi:hypothetical protein